MHETLLSSHARNVAEQPCKQHLLPYHAISQLLSLRAPCNHIFVNVHEYIVWSFLCSSGKGMSEPTVVDNYLNNSRLSPTGNGDSSSRPFCENPSSGQKWWAAAVLGLCFIVINSTPAYRITNSCASTYLGFSLLHDGVPKLSGLLLHGLIFALLMRILLW